MSMNYDHEYDVIVVGSGNGALTSALCSHDGGAKVLVIRAKRGENVFEP